MRSPLAALIACLVLASCATRAAPVVASPEIVLPSVAPAPASTGTALPTATPAPSPAPLALPRCAGSGPDGVIAYCPPGARVDIDAQIGERDAAALLAQVQDDLEAVQREFEWTLRGTPRIDVYATRDRYVAGLMNVFGYSRTTATFVADNSVAYFEPTLARIALNWEELQSRRPIAAIRHELTHVVTLEACAPRCDLVPAWLNEGQAHLAEALIPGADWRLMRIRYEAASMVTTGTIFPLESLWTQGQWNAIADWAGYYKYQEAARATELLRADIGDRAIARLYQRIRAGTNIARAYDALSGKSFETFLDTLESRIAEGIAPGAAMAIMSPGAEGQGVSYLLYGFPAEAHVALRIRARHADETLDIVVSPQGAYFGGLDDTYPPGAYTLTASIGGTTVVATVVKRGGRSNLMVAD